MIYILFGPGSYKIIDAIEKEREKSPNGRVLLRFGFHNTIYNFNFNDILLNHYENGDISYIESEIFNIKNTKEIIQFIFTNMMTPWYRR